MIYLTTGANGASKTLLTLFDVRAQQVKTNRPVYYHGFEPVVEVLEGQFGWKKHDPEKWNDGESNGGVPDGAILMWDEAQTYLGAKQWGTAQPPKWVMDLGVYRRKRGIDIWITGPHPSMFHVSVRRLVASPSWHRHLKRVFGQDVSSQITYDAPNIACEKPGSGADAEVKLRQFPKEVYGWYRSASLHTGKRKIPRALIVLFAAVLLVPTLGYFAVKAFTGANDKRTQMIASRGGVHTSGGPGVSTGSYAQTPGAQRNSSGPQTVAEYLASRQPRIDGFQHTAPAYDSITAPAHAPYPAACIDGTRPGAKARTCECYTQQGTRLQVPLATCESIVRNGFFIEWHQEAASGAAPMAPQVGASVPSIPDASPLTFIDSDRQRRAKDAELIASMKQQPVRSESPVR